MCHIAPHQLFVSATKRNMKFCLAVSLWRRAGVWKAIHCRTGRASVKSDMSRLGRIFSHPSVFTLLLLCIHPFLSFIVPGLFLWCDYRCDYTRGVCVLKQWSWYSHARAVLITKGGPLALQCLPCAQDFCQAPTPPPTNRTPPSFTTALFQRLVVMKRDPNLYLSGQPSITVPLEWFHDWLFKSGYSVKSYFTYSPGPF